MSRRLVTATLLLAAAACSKTGSPAPAVLAATAPAAPQTCAPLWSKVEPAADARGTGTIALSDGVLVFTGKGTFDPCFTDGCTGSNGRLRVSQDRLTGDFDATAVVDALTGGEADLVFFVQSETGTDSAQLRLGKEGGVYGVGADVMVGDGSRSLVDATPEGSARLRLARTGDEVTLTAKGTKGGKVTVTAKLPGAVRVGLAWSSSATGEPVVARISEIAASGGAVQPDGFDCVRFLPAAQ